MKLLLIATTVTLALGQTALAQRNSRNGSEELFVKVREVSHEYNPNFIPPSIFPTPTPVGTKPGQTVAGPTPVPSATPYTDVLPPFPGSNIPGGTPGGTTPGQTLPFPGTGEPGVFQGGGKVNLGDLVTLGTKIWDFVVNNKPTTTYQTLKASVVPAGITNWTQLRGWQKPVSKVYRVEFTNIYGAVAGSFDYRITFVYGGSYMGKGKFIGQLSFVPAAVKLHTDRSLDIKAELLEPLNFGTEDDPVAGAQLQITWSSPTTTRYSMSSVDLFLYGTGEIQNLTDGN
jgi:hypothetical protein